MTSAGATGTGDAGAHGRLDAVPPELLIFIGSLSVQCGGGLATVLIRDYGPLPAVSMRIVFGTVMLLAHSAGPHPRRLPAGAAQLCRPGARPGGDELALLRGPVEDSHRRGGHDRVLGSAGGGGHWLAAGSRPGLGGAGRGRHLRPGRRPPRVPRPGRRGGGGRVRAVLGDLHRRRRASGPLLAGRPRPDPGDARGVGVDRAGDALPLRRAAAPGGTRGACRWRGDRPVQQRHSLHDRAGRAAAHARLDVRRPDEHGAGHRGGGRVRPARTGSGSGGSRWRSRSWRSPAPAPASPPAASSPPRARSNRRRAGRRPAPLRAGYAGKWASGDSSCGAAARTSRRAARPGSPRRASGCTGSRGRSATGRPGRPGTGRRPAWPAGCP